jgi:hypothetical protein
LGYQNNKPKRAPAETLSKGKRDEEVDEPASPYKNGQDDKYENERESEVSLSLSVFLQALCSNS